MRRKHACSPTVFASYTEPATHERCAMSEFDTRNRPIISVAISPRTEGDHERLQQALSLLDVGWPTVIYLETIRKPAEAEGKYIRQTGGSGNYGHCKLRVEPNPRKGYEFIDNIKGGVVPKEYFQPIDQGVQEGLRSGILAGYPLADIKVTLFDGSFHEVDSNEMAFRIAGVMAFKAAARKAAPVLLEPVMAVEVTAPEEHLGITFQSINAGRGRIEGVEHVAGFLLIKAVGPTIRCDS
jgi:elongation factor G